MGGINKVVGAGSYNRFSGQQSGSGSGGNQGNKNRKSFSELLEDTQASSYAKVDVYGATGQGTHIGTSFTKEFANSSVDSYMYDKLLAAYHNPELYQLLEVEIGGRLYNFVSLPRGEQEELLRLIKLRV